MKQFRLPALLILLPLLLVPAWYILKTDAIGTWLFGEKLDYCNVTYCAVTRERFMLVAVPSAISFAAGLLLLIIRVVRSGRVSSES